MSRKTFIGLVILSLNLWAGSLLAQTGAPQPSPESTIVVTAGEYQLTEQMLQRALLLAQILAGEDFSSADAASLRADLITWFQRDPADQAEDYNATAKFLRNRNSHNQVDLAVVRYKFWFVLGQKSEVFDGFKNSPMGKMVLQYNPVLVNSDGMIITQRDVDWQLNSDAFVAQIAGVAPPTQADKDRFVASLPSRFASMPAEERERLRMSQARLASVHLSIDGTIRTKAAVESYIKTNVHSSEDVFRVARQVETDCQYRAKYDLASKAEKINAIAHAQQVSRQIIGMGNAVRNVMKNSRLPQYRYPGGPPDPNY